MHNHILTAVTDAMAGFSKTDPTVHVDRLAAPEAPLKLVLVHGIGGYGRIVLGFGAPFRPDVCEVVSSDLPGYGLEVAFPASVPDLRDLTFPGGMTGAPSDIMFLPGGPG